MKQEMQWLIEQGLYGSNLRRLVTVGGQFCRSMSSGLCHTGHDLPNIG